MKTIEEKAKAYDEALERAKAYHRNELAGSRREMTEYIFPELRESEDEKIIEEIKFALMQMPFGREDTRQRCLAYLEKQKEQKPKNILTDDDSLRTAYLKGQTDVLEDPEAYGLQKEFAVWSEEDIEAFVKSYSDRIPVCGEFQAYHDALVHAYRQGVVNTLKSLPLNLKKLCQ